MGGPHTTDPLKVYIIQAKLDQDTIIELHNLLERDKYYYNGSAKFTLCNDINESDVVVTAIKMRKRLERHIDWEIAKQKAIVTPQWLRDSAQAGKAISFQDYAALSEINNSNIIHDSPENQSRASQFLSRPSFQLFNPSSLEEEPTNERVKANWRLRYACKRASPLVCKNQPLLVELGVLYRARELEGLEVNALGYERAIAVIKSYPNLITHENFETDIVHLPFLGEKMLFKIREYLTTGRIQESETTRASQRFQSLSAFSSVYGVGPATARKLYDDGLRTIDDMKRYYDVQEDTEVPQLGANSVTNDLIRKDQIPNLSTKVGLALYEDLETPIPRSEVEQIHDLVMQEARYLMPECISTVVGGYRRGKPYCNDVDIVIGCPNIQSGGNQVKALGEKLIKRLYDRGYVSHILRLSGFHAQDSVRGAHLDLLEKAMTIFALPKNAVHQRVHRRLDLIFAAPETYWTAIIGWTGSKMFERDLRLWAKVEMGMKFDSSGLTRRYDSKLFMPSSERHVFEILGLDWIDPTMRNADV